MTALVTVLCLAGYLLGYLVYARFLARRIFVLDATAATPAHTQRDDIDYVPTRRIVLFGHHYASITGLAPMLGPAVAVIWGWLPATLWVVLGAIFVGCVHDFSALVVSMRARGMSIGKVTESIIGPRAKTLFHLVIFFGISLAMGVFVYVIAQLFAISPRWQPDDPMADAGSFPSAVLPSGALIVLALILGWLLNRRRFPLLPTTAVGFALTLVAVWAGMRWPLLGLSRDAWPHHGTWVVALLAYSLVASVLPVWSLLQARDFLNSLLLYLGSRGRAADPPVRLHRDRLRCRQRLPRDRRVRNDGQADRPGDGCALHRLRRDGRRVAAGAAGRAGLHGGAVRRGRPVAARDLE